MMLAFRFARAARIYALAATVAAVPLSLASPAVSHALTHAAAGTFPLGCVYGSRRGDIEHEAACAAKTPSGLSIAPNVLAALAYDHGLASLAILGGGWYYRRRDGQMVEMFTFEMGPDYFAEGLARALVDGKLAYVDRALRTKLRTHYDWGGPFAHGRAEVCIGCVETKLDGGEHSMMTGGRWGAIDRQGREIVPVTLTPAEFSKRPQ